MQDYAHYLNSVQRENLEHVKKLENARKEYDCMKTKLENFRDKLSIDVMIPVPSNTPLAFIEGTAVHTNELLVTLGSSYFAKMTTKDTIEFCNRRCAAIEEKINEFAHQNKLFVERTSWLNSQAVSESEIVEHYDEQQEIMWRNKHKEHVKKMKQKEAEERKEINKQPDDVYFSRLDELELEESLSELNTTS